MLNVDNKYKFYEASVQNAEAEVDFLAKQYARLNKKKPLVLREDFCGTGTIACEWIKSSPERIAWAIDLDGVPIRYGMKKHWQELSESDKQRLRFIKADVLKAHKVKADIIAAMNFSYCIFKERALLLKYFQSAHEALLPKGMFFLDIFGGPDSQMPCEERRRYSGFTYHWECQKFNPINNHAKFAIHFSTKETPTKVRKYKNVFTYDWRLWNIVELREILIEAGFKKTIVYWEGDGPKGRGDGIFRPKENEENSASWVAYVGAQK